MPGSDVPQGINKPRVIKVLEPAVRCRPKLSVVAQAHADHWSVTSALFHTFTLTYSLACIRFGIPSCQWLLKPMLTSASLPTTALTVGESADLELDRTCTSTNRWSHAVFYILKQNLYTESVQLQTGDPISCLIRQLFSISVLSCMQSLRKPDNNWEAGIRDWWEGILTCLHFLSNF